MMGLCCIKKAAHRDFSLSIFRVSKKTYKEEYLLCLILLIFSADKSNFVTNKFKKDMEELHFDKKNFSSGLADIEKAMRRMNKAAKVYIGHGVIDNICLDTYKDIQRAFYWFLTAMGETQKK